MQAMTDQPADLRPSLYSLTLPQITAALAELGQPAWRAGQVWRWLYQGLVDDIAAMTDLPLTLRRQLAERFRLHRLHLLARSESSDSPASKLLFGLEDGQAIETVLMHYGDEGDDPPEPDDSPEPEERVAPAGSEAQQRASAKEGRPPPAAPRPAAPTGPGQGAERHTVCLSTQAGCAMGCVFCATGQMGLLRDLDAGECVEQVVWCARELARQGRRLSHVVFMGMGEPLANWDATWATVERLTDPEGLALSPRRLTLSTVGIVPGIDRLSTAGKPVRLAVSLHAPDDALRSRLVGINRSHPLDAILAACRRYQAAGGRRITFEYVLIAGCNDDVAQAKALARRLRGIRSHVNLIPLNPTADSSLQPPSAAACLAFRDAIVAAGISCTLRLRRGIDIQAGCGQLRMRAEGRLGRGVQVPLEAITEAMP